MRKDGHPEKAQQVYKLLKSHHFDIMYDASGSIGRRYARMDEIGTPFCLTCDYQTLEDDTVTIRDRETMNQIRTPIEMLPTTFTKLLTYQIPFDQAGTPVTPNK